MNKKIKIGILTLMVFLTVGCTKYVKDDDKRQVINETTGQTLTSNILCKPITDELYQVYEKYDDKLTTKLEDLPSCEDFKPTDIKYQSLWESIFVKPLAWLILKLGEIVKNYGLSVIIISLLIRIILIPLTKNTMAQSENMKKASKELNKLEQKYANRTDNEAMMQKSQEMMLIYRKYNINPASSCLTSLIQLPLLFAFLEAINRVPAIFEGTLWNMNLGMTPSKALASGNYIYLILLVIIAVSTFFSFKQAMASQPQDGNSDMMRQTKTMTYIMTFMILITSLSLPTALALYWIVNNVFGIVQNFVMKKIKEAR